MHSSRISIIAATIILTVAGFAASADARQPKTEKDCAAKAAACERRCAANGKGAGYGECIERTCSRQYDNCIASLPKSEDGKRGQPTQPGGGVLAHPQAPKPKIGHGPFSPTSGGILDASPGLPGQGPAGTGVPRPPKSGGVIIN